MQLKSAFKIAYTLLIGVGIISVQTVFGDDRKETLRDDQPDKPNILVIFSDDVGWFNIGAYHQGIMSGKTPNIDKLASEGVRFTDYYAEPTCTAGRANFITGQLPVRTGLTAIGLPGVDQGISDQTCTIATALKALGYATGQFGKNHFGDLNHYLPTVHGFDEFHGYLYHLNAMSDPYWYSYPKNPLFRAKYGPRNVIHSWATDIDDDTIQQRWGKVGKQKIVDDGPLPPHPIENIQYNMETFDEVLAQDAVDFMKQAKEAGQPFFIWHNPTRMHVWTNLSEKYKAMMNNNTNYGLEEAGMAQLDDIVGTLMQALEDLDLAKNTIVIFTVDNGAQVFTWPDGGMTPFRSGKGTIYEGGFRVPCIVRWPDKIKPGHIENGIFSSLDWFPTLLAAAGNPDIKKQLIQGVEFGGIEYKNYLDGYDQTKLLLNQAPSARHEIFYFTNKNLGAIRIDNFKFQLLDQPGGWMRPVVTLGTPLIYNLRQDPFERTPVWNTAEGAPAYINEFYSRETWRFVGAQEVLTKFYKTMLAFPPPERGGLDEIRRTIEQFKDSVQAWEGG